MLELSRFHCNSIFLSNINFNNSLFLEIWKQNFSVIKLFKKQYTPLRSSWHYSDQPVSPKTSSGPKPKAEVRLMFAGCLVGHYNARRAEVVCTISYSIPNTQQQYFVQQAYWFVIIRLLVITWIKSTNKSVSLIINFNDSKLYQFDIDDAQRALKSIVTRCKATYCQMTSMTLSGHYTKQ